MNISNVKISSLEEVLQNLESQIALDSKTTMQKFQEYAKILLEWNQIHNLSGANSAKEIESNILDSIYPLLFIEDFQTCLDVGSGAGFPAIPLAIAKPKSNFILTEPRQKRSSFLLFIKSKLGLPNIQIHKSRIEQIDVKANLITSRAVMPTDKLISLCAKNLGDFGYYLLYKGEDSSAIPLDLESFLPSFNLTTQTIRYNARVYLYIKGEKLLIKKVVDANNRA